LWRFSEGSRSQVEVGSQPVAVGDVAAAGGVKLVPPRLRRPALPGEKLREEAARFERFE
jgi:hypothetical protein